MVSFRARTVRRDAYSIAARRATGLLVRHRTRIALTTARRRAVFATATGVSILMVLRLLTTGHVLIAGFATVLDVAASTVLVGILRRIERHRCRGNREGRGTGEAH